MKLSIKNVTKTYPNGVKAINGISLEIQAGMFGLLGPNGAGKSSLMRTIATLQFPDSGSIEFNDLDILADKTEFRRQLGYLPQDFGVYPKESAESLLNYFAILKGLSSRKDRQMMVDRVIDLTNLQDARRNRVSTFSGGMKQRFGIAQLLLNEPKVIIVDEPTAGLDPAERSRFLNVLRSIGTDNIVIFSTHLVEDVRELCRDMAIINKGTVLAQVSPKHATEQLQGKIWETRLGESQWSGLEGIATKLSDRYDDDNEQVNRLHFEGQATDDFVPVSPKLEDFYFLTLNQA